MKKHLHSFLILTSSILCVSGLKAQDTIVKTNGDVIVAKITEVGTNALTYKKWDNQEGANFVDFKTDIVYVRFSNGQKQVFNNKEAAINSVNAPKATGIENTSGKNRIEFMNGKYTLNGQKIGRKDVDRLLAKSTNPAVKISFKVAKTTKTIQKIIGITSIPSTIAGGVATISTLSAAVHDSKHGPGIGGGSITNLATSFVGMLALPITNKILKNRRDKLYDKVIDLYNVAN
ncbi:MAG: hypothetical protein V4506_15035 [Bacteroidota bacterium]